MRYIDGEQYRHLHPTMTNALRMLARVLVRPVELRTADWAHSNFKKAEWRIPKEIMKMRRDHIVPLAPPEVAASDFAPDGLTLHCRPQSSLDWHSSGWHLTSSQRTSRESTLQRTDRTKRRWQEV
jgi:hypothetical protein